jgi:hypothetical protein
MRTNPDYCRGLPGCPLPPSHLFGGTEQRTQWAWAGSWGRVLGPGLGAGSWGRRLGAGVLGPASLGWGVAGTIIDRTGAAAHPSPARGRKGHARSRKAVPVLLSTERRGRQPSTVACGVHLLFECSFEFSFGRDRAIAPNWFFQRPTGRSPSTLMSLPRVLQEHFDHDAELQRYHHRRNDEQLS